MIRFVKRVTLLLSLCLLLAPLQSFAHSPYETLYNDPNTPNLRVQNVYTADRFVTGQETTGLAFSSPSDLFIDKQDRAYVADTGNNRIVVLDGAGKLIRIVGGAEGESALKAPEGVFVTEDGTIYVADTGNRRVAIYDSEGNFVKAVTEPKSELIPQGYYFVPKKLVVDARGMIYLIIDGSYQGIFRMDSEGDFKGFVGANKAKKSWMTWIKQKLYTKEQLEKETANRPAALTNIALDDSGFVIGVTAAKDVFSGQIKRLSGGGMDRLGGLAIQHARLLADVAVDEYDFMYAVDRFSGAISIYDPNGTALFTFGELTITTWQQGLQRYPTSMDINSKHELWLTDGDMNIIQVYKRTAFGEALLTGASLYFNGYYEESKPYFHLVEQSNEMINLTWQAMGKIALGEHRYQDALTYYKRSFHAKGYSEAFWSLRLAWIQKHFVMAVIVLIVLLFLIRLLLKKWKAYRGRKVWSERMRRYGRDLQDAAYLMFHPYEGFYRLKERKVSVFVLFLILAAVALTKLASVYLTGFAFHPVDLSNVNGWMSVVILFVPWLTWVVANYLVSTVKDGEGRFSEVFQASVYALVPYIVFTIPIILLTNVLVLEEQVIITSLSQVMLGWLAVMFFVMTQVIHNFDFMESVKNIVITVCTILIIWLFILIMSGLAYNLSDFFYQFYKEVTFRDWI